MIAVIGAGLSGLVCAKILQENGIDYQLFESSNCVGGRLKTETYRGFLLDHGFQIILNSYPQLQKHLNIQELELKPFEPGCLIYQKPGKTSLIGDPIRRPSTLLSTLTSPIGSFEDKLKILKLKGQSSDKKISTFNFLNHEGFSEQIIKQFFKPFFSGVFLEENLETPANYFLTLYQLFSKGLACLPSQGIQQLPQVLSQSIPSSRIHFKSSLKKIVQNSNNVLLTFENGEEKTFSKVILCLPSHQLAKLMPEEDISSKSRSVTTQYFWAEEEPLKSSYLLLNASGKGYVNHIAFLTQVNPQYSQTRKALMSVNILKKQSPSPEEVLNELNSWNLFTHMNWNHLKTFHIEKALPVSFDQGKSSIVKKNVILAGDYTQTPSIEGAMYSGQRAAETLLKELKN